MKKFKINCFCKINLSLRVLKKLKNGYHAIRSLVIFCDLRDIITISKIQSKRDKINFSGKFSKGISAKKNTITKTLRLLRKKKFLLNQKFRINIKKNIPIGSGLGGGSADAAALLNFLQLKKITKINQKDIIKIANKIGSDVPLILNKKNNFLTNKNRIVKLNKKFRLNVLIVYPNVICSTKRIYKLNKKFTSSRDQISSSLINSMKQEKLINFLKNEKNDLEYTVTRLYPKISKIINFLSKQKGCYFSRITGSGSACIGIFSNRNNAIYSQKMIKLNFPSYWSTVSKTI